jgi:hypothetical protein
MSIWLRVCITDQSDGSNELTIHGSERKSLITGQKLYYNRTLRSDLTRKILFLISRSISGLKIEIMFTIT